MSYGGRPAKSREDEALDRNGVSESVEADLLTYFDREDVSTPADIFLRQFLPDSISFVPFIKLLGYREQFSVRMAVVR